MLLQPTKMIVLNVGVFVFALLVFGTTQAATNKKTKCEVVQALRAHNVPDSDLRDWLCLVAMESAYQYDVTYCNSKGSRDYGIFQHNDAWCDRCDGISGTICWKCNEYGCGDTCRSYIDSNISNDAYCAVSIRNCLGFSAWNGWYNGCLDVSSSAYDYSDS